ncbi:hypothetical protein C8R46DRAFT_1188072 [Mycena filopes]|nr:hypothetical protein C8R46DRAFT_1188072 [Mycena filopes]
MAMYRWLVYLAFFPVVSLAALIVENFTKPALTCESFLIQWQGGIAPWTLSVIEANTAALLENLGTFTVPSFEWEVDLAAGASVLLQLEDSTGTRASSNPLMIIPGTTSCPLKTLLTSRAPPPPPPPPGSPPPGPPPSPPPPSSTKLTGTKSSTISTTSIETITFSASRTLVRSSSISRAVTSFTSQSATLPSSSSSSSVNPQATGALPSPAPTSIIVTPSIASGTAGATQSDIGAYSTSLPAQGLSVKKSSPTGLIVGILIPGLLVLGFFFFFLFRRRRRSTAAGLEELGVNNGETTPTWFMNPAYGPTGNPRVSYGLQSSGSYRTSYQEMVVHRVVLLYTYVQCNHTTIAGGVTREESSSE